MSHAWHASRRYAGIIHFVYLTCSYPGVYTADHFADVPGLALDPAFADYVGEAFKPLGVYVNFFQPSLPAGRPREFLVKLINDHPGPSAGTLRLTLETDAGKALAETELPFSMHALGAQDVRLTLRAPEAPQDNLLLKATATPHAPSAQPPTVSRRRLSVVR